ncbi:hypothetical protein MTO96_001126 [Rhipicephalus appendiculatus]
MRHFQHTGERTFSRSKDTARNVVSLVVISLNAVGVGAPVKTGSSSTRRFVTRHRVVSIRRRLEPLFCFGFWTQRRRRIKRIESGLRRFARGSSVKRLRLGDGCPSSAIK